MGAEGHEMTGIAPAQTWAGPGVGGKRVLKLSCAQLRLTIFDSDTFF